jgi:hypothetical protein
MKFYYFSAFASASIPDLLSSQAIANDKIKQKVKYSPKYRHSQSRFFNIYETTIDRSNNYTFNALFKNISVVAKNNSWVELLTHQNFTLNFKILKSNNTITTNLNLKIYEY